MVLLRIVTLIIFLPVALSAQSYVSGYGGSISRLQTGAIEFPSFRSGPTSTTTPVAGFGGGTRIWKVYADGNLLFARTGETEVVVAPSRQFETTNTGHALFVDGGAGWPLLKIAGFQTIARGGYGYAMVRVPTEIPIEDDRRFWTYGVMGVRSIHSRFVLRFDVRNLHFRREEIPLTLGRFNVVVLGGFGLKL